MKRERSLRLSPSAIELLNNCEASFIYTRMILPRIETKSTQKLTQFGKSFHEAAENGFSDKSIDMLEHTDRVTEQQRKEIEDMRDFIDDIEILNKLTDVRREVELNLLMKDRYHLKCIADMIGKTDNTVVIADWKTSIFPSFAKDYRQMLTYALVVHRLWNIVPESILLIVVYPKAKTVRRYQFTQELANVHERYILSAFKQAERLIKRYEEKGDIHDFKHVLGECGLCPMKGRCIAYRIVSSPVDVDEPDPSTDSLIEEYFTKKEVIDTLSARVDAIKEALMARLDPDNPFAEKDARDKILSRMSLVSRKKELVSIDEYVDRVVIPSISSLLRVDSIIPIAVDTGSIASVLKNEFKLLAGSAKVDAKRIPREKQGSLTVEKVEGRPFLQPQR